LIKVGIIGVGGLGARHLQGVSRIDSSCQIQLVEVSPASRENACRLYEQVEPCQVKKIEWLDTVDSLDDTLDVVIVATSSLVRKQIVLDLLERKKVSYLILEKFLFPALEDYEDVSRALKRAGCKAWVNCTYRMWPAYAHVKELLSAEPSTAYHLTGGNWGLCCNSIHYLDLISYLTDESLGFHVDVGALDIGAIASKRAGYIEFTGTLTGTSARCPIFSMTSIRDSAMPPVALISGKDMRITIREDQQSMWLESAENSWIPERVPFPTQYQSQLSGMLVKMLMDTGTCPLPDYEQSKGLHLILLRAFLQHYNKTSEGKGALLCPIT
jgi:predicted dehydrogenase